MSTKLHCLVERDKIKDDHLSPSSLELYDTMCKLTSCADAIDDWNPDWMRCPVCRNYANEDGIFPHYRPIDA